PRPASAARARPTAGRARECRRSMIGDARALVRSSWRLLSIGPTIGTEVPFIYTEPRFRLSMGPKKEVKKELRSDARDNREKILAAATRLFAKGGIEVGVDDVAREAGLGVGTLYRHFPTKDDLFRATL